MPSDADLEPPQPAVVEPFLPEGLPLPVHPAPLVPAVLGSAPEGSPPLVTIPSFMVPIGTGLYPGMPAPLPPRPRASTAFLIAVTLVSLAADLVTKGWAKARLSGFDAKAHGMKKVEVWKDHVDFIFAQNPGGAWSFLRGLPDSLRRPFFLVVSAAAIVFIISIYQRVYRDQTSMRWGLPLALGGAMGNLADRIRYGWVVDFIDFSMKWSGREHHWPTFNVADIAIVLGVALMAIDMLRSRGLHAYDDHHTHVRPHDSGDAHTSLPVG